MFIFVQVIQIGVSSVGFQEFWYFIVCFVRSEQRVWIFVFSKSSLIFLVRFFCYGCEEVDEGFLVSIIFFFSYGMEFDLGGFRV